MNKVKKLLSVFGAVIMAAVACFSFVGCSVTDKAYEDKQDFFWGAYITPPPDGIYQNNPTYQTLQQYQNIKDCGFTHGISIYENNFETVQKALDLSEQVGIGYYPGYINLSHIINSSDPEYKLTDGDKASLKSFVDEFADHPAFAGIYAVDEPKKDRWHNLKQASDYVHSLPNRENVDLMVSHHAPHADPAATGTTEENNMDLYTSYIETFKPPYICYDSYPLMYDLYDEPIINQQWLDNAQIMAEVGQKYNIPVYYFLLTLGHLKYRTPDDYRDMAWQSNLSLAYGVKGALVFTYWTPMAGDSTYTYGLVDIEGNKTPVWYATQQVIQEHAALNDVYMSFNWTGTMLIEADTDYPNSAFRNVTNRLLLHERIAQTQVSEDTVIGTFKDADNRDAFMVVNYSDPYYAKSDEVKITFNNAKYVSVWRKGVQRVVKLKDGVYQTNLGSGEGEYIIALE